MNKAVTDDVKAIIERVTDDSAENEGSNPTNNRPFYDILRAQMERRDVLKGSLASAATGFFATSAMSTAVQAQTSSKMSFTPVTLADAAASDGKQPLVSPDYDMQVLIPWGDPIEPTGPAYVERGNSSRDQANQIGIGHDGMWFFPLAEDLESNPDLPPINDFLLRWFRANTRGMLCINHEFGNNFQVLGKEAPETLEEARISQHAHGVSVVRIEEVDGVWQTVEDARSRRIHVNSPVEFSGPAAGHPLLQTPAGNIPLGTVNNCGNAVTPWGTYLTCEENFNAYFGATNSEATWVPTELQQRFGFAEGGTFGNYQWWNFDKRFDLSDPDFTNEENRFGWMVEIDPQDATALPVKRTAMGRFKHEGGAFRISESSGQIAYYMGDDERFDYIYKYVSARDYRAMLADGVSPLDEGTLYVARFNEDNTGDWLELSMNNPTLASLYSDLGELLVNTRLAADAVGATPMDRPEWTSTAPDGNVYVTLTNNSNREVADAANPLAPNPDGHIVKILDADPSDTSFTWEIFLIARDTHGTEESFADPDGLWTDPDGRVFIETDGGQKDGLQNQLLIADADTKEIRRLFTGVNGDEITGIAVTPNRRTLFINSQHPGNGDPTQTNFPAATDGVTIPRDCTVVLRRKDGGIVGS
ncbi:MAG: PhoX family phosphatase [Halieaceae bacterium]|jgi:secreted PhoX family phosphatase|nr:PhoX family phosphatase [Halieaceae bacterium]